MKKLLAALALVAGLTFVGSAAASAQTAGQVFCGPAIGYADVCPGDIVPPGAQPAGVTGTLPRTGSPDGTLTMVKTGIVLVAAGAGFTLLATRRRRALVTTS